MNALRKLVVSTICVLAFVAAEGRASAINGGVSPRRVAAHIAYQTAYQNPGVTWTFTTSNLTQVPGYAAPDTVIHVQNFDDPEGSFVAGNDDYGVGYASNAIVPPAATGRWLAVLVRPYGPTTAGSCTLTGTPSSGPGAFSITVNFGGTFLSVGDLLVNSHIATSETWGGTNDSMILAFSSLDRTHAVGFDDDDGIGNMSSLRLKENCTSCTIVFGLYRNEPDSLMNVIWDGDVATNDADQDGLGIGLEGFLGTSSSTALGRDGITKLGWDTDQDGALDGEEVFGVETPSTAPVKYPLMGANPKEKDVFLEMDWVKCAGTTCRQGATGHEDDAQFPRSSIGGPPEAPIPGETFAQATDRIVDLLESTYAPIHLHFDTGLDNTNPYTMTNWGNWGGAQRNEDNVNLIQDQTAMTGFEGLTPGREKRFIHALLFNTTGGNRGGGYVPGPLPLAAFIGFPNYATVRHELGHSLGLYHGGKQAYGGINYRANYVSPMSYLYDDFEAPLQISTFSHGTSKAGTLNGTKLDETKGIGNPPDPAMVAAITQYWCPKDKKCVTSTGSVDWNLDGVISPSSTLVRGPSSILNFPFLARSSLKLDPMVPQNAMAAPALGYAAPGPSAGDRTWLIGRNPNDNKLGFFVLTNAALSVCDDLRDHTDEDGPINCIGTIVTPTAPSGAARLAQFAPAIAELTPTPGGPANQPQGFLVVWQPPTGTLQAAVVSLNAVTGLPTWNASITLPGNLTATDDIAAVTTSPGVVKVYAPVAGRLKAWVYTNPGGFSPTVSDQKFEDNSLIAPKFGIAVTRGYVDNQGAATSYAAIVTSTGDLEFVNETSAGIWKRLNNSWTTNVPKPKSLGRPGLAYVKTGTNAVGRFYMTYVRLSEWGVPETGLTMTEGNLTSASVLDHRLQWKQAFISLGGDVRGAVALNGDVRDNHLRAALTDSKGTTHFMPIADGILNVNMRDVDDYYYLAGNIRASLGLESPLDP